MLPSPLFSDPYSTVVNDKDGKLLGAKIASDGQWRFPILDSVPSNFVDAIVTYEDERYFYHPGIDPIAIIRAIEQNYSSGKIESGASTLTMQIARMSRKGKRRTYWQKIMETLLALRIECSYSKKEILNLYASHAPFGGNVVGLEAASWRYFRKSPHLLSSAEAAMLAVLPNAPSLIHLSKNRTKLLEKRNRLLLKMNEEGLISNEDYELSLLEKIPEKPYPLPRMAPHLVEYIHTSDIAKEKNTTIRANVQQMLTEVADNHYQLNVQSDIHNLSILVLDTDSGNVIGYMGNAPNTQHESSVDMIQAKRSSGSVLKPFLYAHMLNDGKILPKTLLKDIPTQIQGYSPKNYNRQYHGAISADKALAMSLNVPMVNSLQNFGVDPFLRRLKEHQFTTINKSAEHYGLSLILGGAEISLWELCGAYASIGRILNTFNRNDSKYNANDNHLPLLYVQDEKKAMAYDPNLLSAGAIYQTFEAMKQVMRPGEEGQWEQFESAQTIAWKTGTSYGHRDAWAVGVSPKYTIGVWIGNADGEGKHNLVGVKKAGPILFDVLNRLPSSPFFEEPMDDLLPIVACRQSGYIASRYCTESDTIYALKQGENSGICPYHKVIHTDGNGYQVTSECMSPSEMIHENWFGLKPSMAYYYKREHPEYIPIPPYRSDCLSSNNDQVMEFIYPQEDTKIYLPMDMDGVREKAIFKATHHDKDAILYWHLDEEYLGHTEEMHTMEISANGGNHAIIIVDQWGNSVARNFEVVQ